MTNSLFSTIRERRTAVSATVVMLTVVSLLVLISPRTLRADTPNRAVVVVSLVEGLDIPYCVSFDEEEISGYELLRRTGLSIISESSGIGEAVCRIEGTGCSFPQTSCFCECLGSDCTYWSYWKLQDGAWEYSVKGASQSTVRNRSVQGWVWGEGTVNQDASRQPALVTWDEVCGDVTNTPTTQPATDTPTGTWETTATETPTDGPSPTFTLTPTPSRKPSTSTPTLPPTVTNTPTPGPTHTVTPTPFAPPTILVFTADRSSVLFGESVALAWDVVDSNRVVLRYPGGEEEVSAQGSKVVTPEQSTDYALFAASPVGQAEAVFRVDVNPVISAPTPAPKLDSAPNVESTPTPTETWTPTWTPLPTETSTEIPEATEMPSPTWTPLPTETSALAQADYPLVVTVVVTPQGIAIQTKAPPVELLAPGENLPVAAGIESEDAATEGVFLASGILFVVGAPLVFAGLWLIVWWFWRKR